MTDYPYQPPEREYADTMQAFGEWRLVNSGICVHIEPDPLGPVNKIVSLTSYGRRIKSTLAHVPAGATVRPIRDEGGYRIEELALQKRIWDTRGDGGEQVATIDVRVSGWRVEVDGRTVLAVTDAEMLPPKTPQRRPKPSWARLRRAMREKARSAADGLAGRLGYHREDDCPGGDDWC
jgi:hypothetical protein